MATPRPKASFDPFRQVRQLYHTALSPHRELFSRFHAKVRLHIERGAYEVKTAETMDELDAVLRLRYEVFHREMAQRRFPIGIDIDRYDWLADHLIVVHKATRRVVGTYRLTSSSFSSSFYSETEFDIRHFLQLPGTKIELSRACVHKDHRTGTVMTLLWRGVAQYLNFLDAKYLFGCASVWTMDPTVVKKIQSYLRPKHELSVAVACLPEYRFESLALAILAETPTKAPEEIPTLFRSYLKMGARIAMEPALDRKFRCVDFFTALEWASIRENYEKKYTAC